MSYKQREGGQVSCRLLTAMIEYEKYTMLKKKFFFFITQIEAFIIQ